MSLYHCRIPLESKLFLFQPPVINLMFHFAAQGFIVPKLNGMFRVKLLLYGIWGNDMVKTWFKLTAYIQKQDLVHYIVI